MVVPKYHEFMKPLLERLADDREHKIRDLYAERTQTFRLTEADRSEYLPIGKQPTTALMAICQFERDNIVQHKQDGLCAARACGRKEGRPPLPQAQIKQTLALYDSK